MSAINNIVSSSIHPAVAGQDASSFSQASTPTSVVTLPADPPRRSEASGECLGGICE